MQVELSPADASYISELVKNGYFGSEKEALSAVISHDKQQYESKRQRLLNALAEGEADIKAGRTIPYTPELLDKIFEEAVAAVERGEEMEFDPDVIP